MIPDNQHESDNRFHDNLSEMCAGIEVPAGPAHELRSRCDAILKGEVSRTQKRSVLTMMKQPKVLSAMGLAASISLVALLGVPWWGGHTVRAEEIINKLNQQIAGDSLIEISIESLNVDEVSVNGWLQITDAGLAGDIAVTVADGSGDQEVNVDLSLGISDGDGWVLIRKLEVDDPQAQAMISTFLMAGGGEVLIQLPADALDGKLDIRAELEELRTGKISEVLKQLIESHDDFGAEIEEQADGTILLTLDIDDTEALASLEGLLQQIGHGDGDGDKDGDEPRQRRKRNHHHDISVELHGDSGGEELIGTTVSVVYDPEAEAVRSLAVENIGGPGSRVTVSFGEGEIDPKLLDSSRVASPDTPKLDLGALEALFGGGRHKK